MLADTFTSSLPGVTRTLSGAVNCLVIRFPRGDTGRAGARGVKEVRTGNE